MRYPRAWKIAPYLLLAAGVFGFLRLADHNGWSGGVTVLIGALMLALFVMIVGPITMLPAVIRSQEGNEPGGELTRKLLDVVRDSLRAEQSSSTAETEIPFRKTP